MNKKILIALLVTPLIASTLFAQDEDEKTHTAWFDMDNCAICKCMSDHKEMMGKVKWETHMLDNGFLSISVVPDDMKPMMKKAKEHMEKTIAKLEDGEEMELCGYCTSFGGLLEAGAKKEELETAGGHILILTAKDPAVVKKIHEHAKKSIAEHKKMMEQMKQTHTSDGRK